MTRYRRSFLNSRWQKFTFCIFLALGWKKEVIGRFFSREPSSLLHEILSWLFPFMSCKRKALASSNLNNSLAFTIFPRGCGATLCPWESLICQETPRGKAQRGFFGRYRMGRESPLTSEQAMIQLTAIIGETDVLSLLSSLQTSGKTRSQESSLAKEVSWAIARS